MTSILILMFCAFLPAIGAARRWPTAETHPPEVPPSVATINMRRDAWLVRAYRYVWGQYPRDICSVFPRLVLMIVVGLLDVGATLMVGFMLLTGFVTFLIGIWHLIPMLPAALAQIAWWVVGLPSATAAGFRYAASTSVTYQLLAATTAVALLVLFFRSKAWQLTRLYARSKKDRVCLKIRIV
ncbi:hypothetical protein HYZ80_00195 [Candidatus Parcubacteria bacterium]|nr:hypothetical protein [Candidatus Parcubacteria bacterium]